MNAVAIHGYGGREVLRLVELPDPQPGIGEIRIRVAYAGVNPVDWKIREGRLKDRMPSAFPLIPGWDAAGVVDRVGSGVDAFRPGDEVFAYCRKSVIQHGTYAEYVVVPADAVALRPARVGLREAAAIPLAALTAWQSLFDAVKLARGEAVLVQAAAGGVGGYAVQLAKWRGCMVIGTASANHHGEVRALGVDHVVDYHGADVPGIVRALSDGGVDVAFDCVGFEVMDQCAACLKPAGRLVSILSPDRVEALRTRGIDAHYVFVAPNGAQLREIAGLVDAGGLRVRIAAEFPLAEAARAHELIEGGHVAGKIVLRI